MTQQSERLAATLKRLGCPSVPSSSSVEWLYHYEATKPLLRWISENLDESNVLTREEVEQFEQLEASGLIVYDEQQLNEGLRAVSSDGGGGAGTASVGDDATGGAPVGQMAHVESTAELEEQLDQLEIRLSRAKARRQRQTVQRDLLLAERSRVLEHVGDESGSAPAGTMSTTTSSDVTGVSVDDALQVVTLGLQMRNDELNERLETLARALQATTELHEASGEQRSSTFLFHQDVAGFLARERSHAEQLVRFCDELLPDPQVAASRAAERARANDAASVAGRTSFEHMRVNDPTSLLVHGDDPELYERHRAEVERLRQSFSTSMQQHIRSCIQATRAEVSRTMLVQAGDGRTAAGGDKQQQQSACDENAANGNSGTCSDVAAGDKFTSVDKSARWRMRLVLDEELPHLCARLSILRLNSLFQSSNEFKRTRQQLYFERQSRVFELLFAQLARLTVAMLLFEREHSQDLAMTHELAKHVKFLDKLVDEAVERSTRLGEISSSASVAQWTDDFAADILRSLELSRSTTVADLDELNRTTAARPTAPLTQHAALAEEQRATATSAQNARQGAAQRVYHEIGSARAANEKIERALFSRERVNASKADIQSLQLHDAHDRLSENLERLSSAMEGLVRERTERNEQLQRQPEMANLERRLFTLFFNEPDQLVATVSQLDERLVARRQGV